MAQDIKVLGPGCPRCEELFKLTRQAVMELDLACSVEKITDIREITNYGVMMTPALVIDGVVKMSGKVPSLAELKRILG